MAKRLLSALVGVVMVAGLFVWAPPFGQIKPHCHPHHHHFCQGL